VSVTRLEHALLCKCAGNGSNIGILHLWPSEVTTCVAKISSLLPCVVLTCVVNFHTTTTAAVLWHVFGWHYSVSWCDNTVSRGCHNRDVLSKAMVSACCAHIYTQLSACQGMYSYCYILLIYSDNSTDTANMCTPHAADATYIKHVYSKHHINMIYVTSTEPQL
jgi:hypothetical protein